MVLHIKSLFYLIDQFPFRQFNGKHLYIIILKVYAKGFKEVGEKMDLKYGENDVVRLKRELKELTIKKKILEERLRRITI